MQPMMILPAILLILSLINLTTSQIPNPKRYQITVTKDGSSRQHYSIDKILSKASRKGFSIENDKPLLTSQDIYVPMEGRTYSFTLTSSPPQCIANRGAPFNYIDYWFDIVKAYGGENKTYDQIIVDQDCGGECLTWSLEYNSTAIGYTIKNRLYIKKINLTPIKLTSKLYHFTTGDLVVTYLSKYTDWNLNEITDSEYDFPMDINKCYYA
jgi:hypothetical protein